MHVRQPRACPASLRGPDCLLQEPGPTEGLCGGAGSWLQALVVELIPHSCCNGAARAGAFPFPGAGVASLGDAALIFVGKGRSL